MAFGLAAMKGVPFEACHLPTFLFICLRTLLPQVAVLLGVFLARSALYQGVQFLLDHLAACYVHLSSLPVMAHGIVLPHPRIRPYITVISVTTVTAAHIPFIYAAFPCDDLTQETVTVTLRIVTS